MADARPLQKLLDRFGSDFATWRDQSRAVEARRAIMASQEDRAHWEAACRLDEALLAHERAAREALARDPLVARVESGVLRALDRRASRLSADAKAFAAAFIVCAFLGGTVAGLLAERMTQPPVTLAYSVDSLVFGYPEVDEWQ